MKACPESLQTSAHWVESAIPVKDNEEKVQILIEWASQNSFSGNGPGLWEMAKLLDQAFARLPGESQIISLPAPGGVSGSDTIPVYRRVCRPEAPWQVLLNGHFDTVYQVRDQPTVLRRENGILHGPGVADMKGGLVVLLEALRAFEHHPAASSVGWEVLLTPDEETGSITSAALLDEAAARNHLGIVFESALPDGALIRCRKGSGVFTAEVRGKGAHVGRDFHEGRNAISALARLVGALDSVKDGIPGVILNVGKIEGGGPLNQVPDYATASWNIRVDDDLQIKRVEEALRTIREDFAVREECLLSWQGEWSRPPKPVTPMVVQLFEAWRKVGRACGQDLFWRDTGGGSDGANLLAAGLPNIDNLGVRGGGLHSPGEFMVEASLTERTRMTTLFLAALATGCPEVTDTLAEFRERKLHR